MSKENQHDKKSSQKEKGKPRLNKKKRYDPKSNEAKLTPWIQTVQN
jgi:hypothetical protein